MRRVNKIAGLYAASTSKVSKAGSKIWAAKRAAPMRQFRRCVMQDLEREGFFQPKGGDEENRPTRLQSFAAAWRSVLVFDPTSHNRRGVLSSKTSTVCRGAARKSAAARARSHNRRSRDPYLKVPH